jgi:cell division protein FtsZ
VIDDSLGDEVRITVIAAGFDRYDGEKRPSRGLTSLGLDDDDDLGDGIDFSMRGDDDGDGDDQFDVPEFLR